MSAENPIAIVGRLLAAHIEMDVSGFQELCSPDVEIRPITELADAGLVIVFGIREGRAARIIGHMSEADALASFEG